MNTEPGNQSIKTNRREQDFRELRGMVYSETEASAALCWLSEYLIEVEVFEMFDGYYNYNFPNSRVVNGRYVLQGMVLGEPTRPFMDEGEQRVSYAAFIVYRTGRPGFIDANVRLVIGRD